VTMQDTLRYDDTANGDEPTDSDPLVAEVER